MKNRLSFCILTLAFCIFTGCGAGSIVENIQDAATKITDETALNLAPQDNLFAIAASFTDPVGSIATVGLNNPHTAKNARAITDSSDAVIRSFGGKIYVVNRGTTSSIQVIDPESFSILGNYSVGVGSNPQDIIVTGGKAYITRLDSEKDKTNTDDLWIVDPLNGAKIKTIDLKPYTTDDGDRLARANLMALVGDKLYILLQDLSTNFSATTNGKLVVLSTQTDTVLQSIPLAGRDPTDIQYNSSMGKLFIADSGFFDSNFNNDTGTSYGGIETVDTTTNTSSGIVIDDANFGGYVSMIRQVSDTLALATVDASTIATFNPQTLTIGNKKLYTSPGAFLSDLLIDRNGLLWIPERDPKNAGLVLLDPQTGNTIAGPFAVGALPASLTLIK
ncbi:MAG: hypothetical protein A3H42_04200 [Deltaproteobacteria bacterium RIFCSPLOWO2_02_FULL_46_8]|nr:MAG: hypothetical protein A3H42_04200 [Deltaproteobacteria bacterium RIFCSPLOWO2_02_FULL_46_8]